MVVDVTEWPKSPFTIHTCCLRAEVLRPRTVVAVTLTLDLKGSDNVHLCQEYLQCKDIITYNGYQQQDNTIIITFYGEDVTRNKITANLNIKYHW